MSDCHKGCQQGHVCLVRKHKEKNSICPCKECLIKGICEKQCMDRKDLYYAHTIEEYQKYKERIHQRILSANEARNRENLIDHTTVFTHINRKNRKVN